ncbi:MAG: hypothetical protein M3Z05_08995 [Gemmatimonadota bacterium]|nr:hypothetical protein [Gemmatimonadota bacterium]
MRKISMLVLALGLAACANDSTAPSTSINGNYTLRTVNGSALPYTFSNGLQLTNEQLVLNSDGSFTDASQYSNGQTSVDSGYYTSLNGSITFNDVTAGVTYQGSLSGTVLTEIVSGFTQTFQKN